MKKRESESTWNVVRGHVQGWLGTAGHIVVYLPNKLVALVSPPAEKATSTHRSKPSLARASTRKKAR